MKHYAGDVTYASVGFREKNKDTLHPDLSGVMRESQSDFVRTLFPDDSVAASPAKGADARRQEGEEEFGRQDDGGISVHAAARIVDGYHQRHGRPLCPMHQAKREVGAEELELAHTAYQFRCAGVLEAIRISVAYPNRMHADFVWVRDARVPWAANAGISLRLQRRRPPTRDAQSVRGAAEGAGRGGGALPLGSKVFFRAFMLEKLEQCRGAALAVSVVLIHAMRAARGGSASFL